MSRIFINTCDIAILEGISPQRASEIMRTIMDSFQKKKPQKLTIPEYCKYRGISDSVVISLLKH